jgi:hypothetical protein
VSTRDKQVSSLCPGSIEKSITLSCGLCSQGDQIPLSLAELNAQARLLNTQQQLLDGILKLNQHLLFFQELIAQEIADGHAATNAQSTRPPAPDNANERR